MSPKDCAYIVERLAIRFMALVADHERQLSEHRTSFGARTEADAKIIAGLRSDMERVRNSLGLQAAKEANKVLGMIDGEGLRGAAERVVQERDGLLTQVQDMRAEIRRRAKEQDQDHKTIVSLISERDALRAEVAALKSQTPNQHGRWVRATSEKCTHAKAGVVSVRGYLVRTNSGEFLWEGKDCEPCDPPQTAPVPKRAHPVAVGGYLRRLTGFNTTPAGEVARVTLVDGDESSQLEYEVVRPNGQKGRWSAKGCEPCDPPEATHDTEAGKAAAESGLLLNGGLDVRKVMT